MDLLKKTRVSKSGRGDNGRKSAMLEAQEVKLSMRRQRVLLIQHNRKLPLDDPTPDYFSHPVNESVIHWTIMKPKSHLDFERKWIEIQIAA